MTKNPLTDVKVIIKNHEKSRASYNNVTDVLSIKKNYILDK